MSNLLELNQGDDFIFLLDVSGSMGATDTPTGQTRYDFAKEKAIAFCNEAAKIDADGISIFRFGHAITKFSDITPDQINKAFEGGANEMSTNTAGAIKAAWDEHLERKNEQTFVLIVTDGAPADKDAVKKTIIDITHAVKDEREFNIAFLQVGQDKDVAAFLSALDDDLKGAKYDIVDVKRLEDVDFMAAVAGAMND
jgi:nitric oxide reductase activation protein